MNWTWTELKGTHAAKRMCFQNIWTDSRDCHVIYAPFGETRLNTGREEALPSGCIKHFEFISECRLSKGKPSMNILWDNENSSGFFFQADQFRVKFICMLGTCWWRYFGVSVSPSCRCVVDRCAVLGLISSAAKGQRANSYTGAEGLHLVGKLQSWRSWHLLQT